MTPPIIFFTGRAKLAIRAAAFVRVAAVRAGTVYNEDRARVVLIERAPAGLSETAVSRLGGRVGRQRSVWQTPLREACQFGASGSACGERRRCGASGSPSEYHFVLRMIATTVLDRFRLDGRVAFVTGGRRGLGRAFAQALAEAGARVAISSRVVADGEQAAEQLRQAGAEAISVSGDVTNPADVEAMVAAVEGQLGPIDVLVNNAGVVEHRPALEVTPESWRSVLAVNLDGLWFCCQAVGQRMVERRQGVIVNIGSISGAIVNRPQWQPAYNASKAAVHQLTRSLAGEWAPYGVRANALALGYIRTEMSPPPADPQTKRWWVDDVPMQRMATPEEVAPAVVYLASDASRFMTGAILVVDGGYTVW